MTKRTILILIIVLLSNCFGAIAWSQNICESETQLLQAPTPEFIKQCLHSVWFALGRNQQTDRKFAQDLVTILLPVTTQENGKLLKLEEFDIDYSRIAEIISLLKSDALTKKYIDFIIKTEGSADELRSFGLGKLYTLRAPYFLKTLAQYRPKDQQVVIRSLAWGLVNNFYPHLTTKNYRRLIIGEYWELLDDKQGVRSLAASIEKEVLAIVEDSRKVK